MARPYKSFPYRCGIVPVGGAIDLTVGDGVGIGGARVAAEALQVATSGVWI